MRVRMDVSVSILFIFVESGAGAPRAWCPVRSSRDGRLFLARACRTHSSFAEICAWGPSHGVHCTKDVFGVEEPLACECLLVLTHT